MDNRGRLSKDCNFFGLADKAEALYGNHHLPANSIYEVLQNEFADEWLISLARRDRFYTSQPVYDQLDRHVYAVTLEWVPHSSAHRPLAFCRCSWALPPAGLRPTPDAVLKHDAWPLRTAVEYRKFLAEKPAEADAVRRPVLLKCATHTAASSVQTLAATSANEP
jgi:hypothetical protein